MLLSSEHVVFIRRMNPLPAILVQIKIARIHAILFFQSKHIFTELYGRHYTLQYCPIPIENIFKQDPILLDFVIQHSTRL